MSDKKYMYYKIYQDRNSMDGEFCLVDVEKGNHIMACALMDIEETDDLPPVIEPVLMTEEEFKKQPVFIGY